MSLPLQRQNADNLKTYSAKILPRNGADDTQRLVRMMVTILAESFEDAEAMCAQFIEHNRLYAYLDELYETA